MLIPNKCGQTYCDECGGCYCDFCNCCYCDLEQERPKNNWKKDIQPAIQANAFREWAKAKGYL